MENITLDQLMPLVDQLQPNEQDALIKYLQQRSQQRKMTLEQKRAMLDSLIFDAGAWSDNISLRREDWYSDDER
jgi:hypothetical protein